MQEELLALAAAEGTQGIQLKGMHTGSADSLGEERSYASCNSIG